MQTPLCHECGGETREDTILKKMEMKHDGSVYNIEARVPVFICTQCNARVFDGRADDLLTAALRDKIGLYHPHVIRQLRQRCGLSQVDVANGTGLAKESICRWECGHTIQSIASNRLLRYFFEEQLQLLESHQRVVLTFTVNYDDALEIPWKPLASRECAQEAIEPQYALAA